MDVTLPPELKMGIERMLQGVSRTKLARAAAVISDGYRGGTASKGMIYQPDDALAYLLSRLPATYAAVGSVLARTVPLLPDFAPESLLDVGAGPGTASWAATRFWPHLASITMIDGNKRFLELAAQLAEHSSIPALHSAIIKEGDITKESGVASDVVVVSYALAELPLKVIGEVIRKHWDACRKVMVVVEPGTPQGFERIRACRDILREDGAKIIAPCTHDGECPMAGGNWCHFVQRLARSRDHMIAKAAAVPFEDEKFSYLVVGRDVLVERPNARIVARAKVTKAGVTHIMCSQAGLTEQQTMHRDRENYNRMKKCDWGDAV